AGLSYSICCGRTWCPFRNGFVAPINQGERCWWSVTTLGVERLATNYGSTTWQDLVRLTKMLDDSCPVASFSCGLAPRQAVSPTVGAARESPTVPPGHSPPAAMKMARTRPDRTVPA